MKADVIVIGAGVAGASAALGLARAGASVALVERERAIKAKVCGEFLSTTTLAELARLRVDPLALGGVPLTRFRLSAGARGVTAPLPFQAVSLGRERLDTALVADAAAAGARVLMGRAVRAVERTGALHTVRLTDGGAINADRVVVATGKADLKSFRRSDGVHRGLVGLKQYVRLGAKARAALEGSVELVLYPGGYCGIQLVADDLANVCLVAEAARLGGPGGAQSAFDTLMAETPRCRDLLQGAESCTARPLAVGRLPYGFVRGASEGPYFIGDQAAVIPSLCGEGIGIALSSARAACEAIVRGQDAAAFQPAYAAAVRRRVVAAGYLSRALCHRRLQSLAVTMAHAPRLAGEVLTLTRAPWRSPLTAGNGVTRI